MSCVGYYVTEHTGVYCNSVLLNLNHL